MLVTMKEMLSDAKRHHYAVPAFDISNYEMMRAVLDVCQEEGSPALLMGVGFDFEGKGMNLISSMILGASNFYTIPICLHLDHAEDINLISAAIGAGFRSVMYDGSKLPFEENAKNTAEVVRLAHAKGVTVEAELGHVGNSIAGSEENAVIEEAHIEDPESTLTDPAEVKKFIEITDTDALAVAIGTSHGVYKKTPKLRIDRLDDITAVCDRPLVLHGGSGTPDEQMREAVAHGITKINIYSDLVAALNRGLKHKLNSITNLSAWPVYVFEEARRNMREVVRDKLRVFGSAGRV